MIQRKWVQTVLGQSGDLQALSEIEDEDADSVEELADNDQAVEAESSRVDMPPTILNDRPIRTRSTAIPMTCLLSAATTRQRC
jgi:hypothetical protein